MSAEQHTEVQAHAHDGPTVKGIWKVFWILLILTAVEFIIALAIPTTVIPRTIKNYIFIVLTIAKAYYIVNSFMHMKYEKPSFTYAIFVPMVFLIGFLFALLSEGSYWLLVR
ncbi:MAG: cytochrome c oxidase subunit 4 [Sphingobacteriales bacterium]|jgi:cytochrome c oxidase subunit 4